MALIFFDSSALVRRYDRAEPGARRVRTLCRRSSGHNLAIASITPVELASAFNRKYREGIFTQAELTHVWSLFRGHRRQRYQVISLDVQTYERAERLLFAHRLRAYDAVQLAAVLGLARLLAGFSPNVQFCTADRDQAEAARREGLAVELIT